MGPNALFSFDNFINMTIFFPLITFRRHPCSSSTGIYNRAAVRRTVVMVFASSPRQFYRDGTNPAHLSGLSHLDNFIMTRKPSSIYRDFAKTHANPDTDGNSLYHRAVMFKRECAFLDRFALISSYYPLRQITPKHNLPKRIC
jgi:hypothetical protein